jgi:hypothetical protein
MHAAPRYESPVVGGLAAASQQFSPESPSLTKRHEPHVSPGASKTPPQFYQWKLGELTASTPLVSRQGTTHPAARQMHSPPPDSGPRGQAFGFIGSTASHALLRRGTHALLDHAAPCTRHHTPCHCNVGLLVYAKCFLRIGSQQSRHAWHAYSARVRCCEKLAFHT